MPHVDLEKGDTMADKEFDHAPISTNRTTSGNSRKRSSWPTNLSTTIPLTIAYISLYLTNYYLSPSRSGAQQREGDEGRMPPLVIILMLLGPDIIQKAFAVTITSSQNESPCFGFGWPAYSASLLVPVVSGSGGLLPEPEFGVKVLDVETGRSWRNGSFGVCRLLRDLESRYIRKTGDSDGGIDSDVVIEILKPTGSPSTPNSFWATIQNRSMATGLLQFYLAGIFWYYCGDLSVLLLLSTSILLLKAVANLPAWPSQKYLSHTECRQDGAFALMRDTGSSPQHIFIIRPTHPNSFNVQSSAAPHVSPGNYTQTTFIPAIILVSGGFLSQALLCTQLSDAAAIAMLIIMFCGTISNVAMAALPREPMVDGVKLQSVGGVSGKGGVVGVLREVESMYEGFGEVLVIECFPERLGEWEGKMGDIGEMD